MTKETMKEITVLTQMLRREREKRRISQEKVSQAMGISKSTVSEMEAGKSGVALDRWIEWCSALRISPNYVMDKWQRMGGLAIESHQGHGEQQ